MEGGPLTLAQVWDGLAAARITIRRDGDQIRLKPTPGPSLIAGVKANKTKLLMQLQAKDLDAELGDFPIYQRTLGYSQALKDGCRAQADADTAFERGDAASFQEALARYREAHVAAKRHSSR